MNANVFGKMTFRFLSANIAIIDMKINVHALMVKLMLIVGSVFDD